MSACECGCGKNAVSGAFLPGHDQKLRISLENRVGGLLALREIVESAELYVAGEYSPGEYTEKVRTILRDASRK